MSTSFKVGDCVRRKDGRSFGPTGVYKEGGEDTRVVTSVSTCGSFIRFEGLGSGAGVWNFELAPPATFKVGDEVVIARKGRSDEPGFANSWADDMDSYVSTGEVLTIRSITDHGVYFKGYSAGGFGYPKSCLELASTVVAPAAPAVIDLSTLKVGDKVTITTTYEVEAEPDCDGDVPVHAVSQNVVGYLFASTTYEGAVEHVPQPLTVGEAVTTKSGARGTIKSIFDDMATVSLSWGNFTTRPLDELTRA